MPTITARTAEVLIYQGDDLAKLSELYEAVEIAKETGEDEPRRISELPAAEAARKVYDKFVTEAAERAVTVTVKQVGRRRWREVRDTCPAAEKDEIGQMLGFDRDALGEALVPESIIAPVFASTDERAEFLDALSEADWDRLVNAVVGVNTSVIDPKAVRRIGSGDDQESDENSKPPERLA